MHPNAANYFLPRRIRRCAKGKADMKSSVKLAFSLFVGLFAVIELAHFASGQTTTLNAYVYVINRLNGPINELDGFSADSTGPNRAAGFAILDINHRIAVLDARTYPKLAVPLG